MMELNHDSVRDRLLSDSPQPADLEQYRHLVSALLDSNEKRIRRERVLVTAFWVFCAVSAVAWLWFSADAAHFPRGPFLACIFFIWGGVEIVKHHINTAQLAVLKEVKQLQIEVFTLQSRVGLSNPQF
jgi:hypothetical protein